jgi:hypothetical protein
MSISSMILVGGGKGDSEIFSLTRLLLDLGYAFLPGLIQKCTHIKLVIRGTA